jgi:NADH-quinone oxidoreductase subunit G
VTDQKVNLTIDGTPIAVPAGTLVWEAASQAGSDVPIFCYHSKLGPVGVCRMCMVEIEGQPKLATACTTGVTEGMVIRTKTPDVEKAQRGVLEFLLVNHPLDCPICDRAGECPLQDQTFEYGPGVSRFIERKRHYLKPIHLGTTIDLDRERCILCWRCVRFTSEIANDDQLILVDRGSETYIGTYESKPYESEFSGNVIELCPVGALTSRKQRFSFRPWELKEHSSICHGCAMGCNIQIDVRDDQQVTRFRARTNDEIDDGWLCDRGRFGYDFIGSPNRIKTPLIREDGALRPTSWSRAYRAVAENLLRTQADYGADSIAGFASATLPNEDLFVFKKFMNTVLGSTATDYWPRPELGARELAPSLDASLGSISNLDRASVILVIGTDPSEREPVMELRVRKAVNKRGAKLIEIGSKDISLTDLAHATLRCEPDQITGIVRALTMTDVVPSDLPEFAAAQTLLAGDGPVVILYEELLLDMAKDARVDVLTAISALVGSLGERASVIPMLLSANEMAARDFGLAAGGAWSDHLFRRVSAGEFKAAFIAGADIAADRDGAAALEKLDFLAVTAHTESATTAIADVVLPESTFAERVGTVTNTSRRVQVFSSAVSSPGIALPSWQILVQLSQRWDSPLTYSSPEEILVEIGTQVPAYRDLIPSSYAAIGATGRAVSAGAEAAAQ